MVFKVAMWFLIFCGKANMVVVKQLSESIVVILLRTITWSQDVISGHKCGHVAKCLLKCGRECTSSGELTIKTSEPDCMPRFPDRL